MSNRLDLVIINRSFWPVYPVIGEALMRLAENQSYLLEVGVILQDHADIKSQLAEHERGNGVQFFPCHAFSVSGSSIIRRIGDAVFFMIWVFFILLFKRPRKIYVSTDPPVLVPFIVMLYSKLFGAEYIYHLQDIHPEAANIVIPVQPMLFRILRKLDSFTMRHASVLITITSEMAEEIKKRSGSERPIRVLSNPSVAFTDVNVPIKKHLGFSFCGNAGRLQRIPLLIDAIDKYCSSGGSLPFVFAGAGVYTEQLKTLSNKHANVSYLGLVSPQEAAQLNADYQWALLPIDNKVTRYAFPSKSSSYVYSGAYIAAVCSDQTSVAKWVTDNKLGVVVKPTVESLCGFFVEVERQEIDTRSFDIDRQRLKQGLGFDFFVEQLTNIILLEGSR